MSANFMFAIAAMYAASAACFWWEGKYIWMVVAVCWGIGNALIALLSLK